MSIKIPTVRVPNTKYPNQSMMKLPKMPLTARPDASVLEKKTVASWECASERAHNLKYEAVLEIVPSTNSIVSIS